MPFEQYVLTFEGFLHQFDIKLTFNVYQESP
jgi:hypothetical protein